MGQDCENVISMALESVKDADAIVYCDGGSTDNTRKIIDEFAEKICRTPTRIIWIENSYNQEDKGMNGKQRNFYLDYVKKHYPDWWCLCIDADEVVTNINYFKSWIQEAPPGVYCPRMRHLIGDLAHEDTISSNHYVLNRLFKISEADKYPEQEHPVLKPKTQKEGRVVGKLVIWHLAYIPSMFDIKKKYENHMEKSQVHTKDYLRWWYFAHLFGTYPRERFNIGELPEVILKEFGTSHDETYFIGRGEMELKHYQDAINWKEFFKLKTCLIFGCGMGPRVYTLNKFGVETKGIEINKYAVKQRLHENVEQGDMTVEDLGKGTYDLTVAFDVLEHLNKGEDLFKAIDNLINHTSKYILVSIPVLGNPALDLDVTHKIKESEEWWLKQFTERGLKQIKTPDNFLYKEQVYIFEK